MIPLTQLVSYLSDLLKVDSINDYCPNGLQVSGKPMIQTIVTGVTANQALLEAAIASQADMVLVHHGYFWRGEDPCLIGVKRKRLAMLLAHDINLLCYHLPLDTHLVYGNNAKLAELFNWQVERQLNIEGIKHLVWVGNLLQPLTPTAFAAELQGKLQHVPLHIAGRSTSIKRIAWCTGAAHRYVNLVSEMEVDAYITGEIAETTVHEARENGIHLFAAGHHATERYGIKALGEHLATEFNLKHCFIDIPSPV